MKRIILIVLLSLTCLLAIISISGYFVFLDRVEGQYVQSNGTKIHYTVEGEGEPVVLLHGFAVNANLNWRLPGIIDELSKEFQVIAMDLRGHGLSGKPYDKEKYGIQMVEDVRNLLSHLNIDKAHLVGYSLGGFITLKAATQFPHKWRKVIVMGAGWENPETSSAIEILDQVSNDLKKHQTIDPIVGYFEDRPEPGLIHKAAVRIMTGWFNDTRALVPMIDGLDELTITEEQLQQIKAPLYCIVGENDPLLPSAKELHQALPQTTFFIVPDGTHMTTTRKDITKQKLRAFLQEDNEEE